MTLFKNCLWCIAVLIFMGCSTSDGNELPNPDSSEEEVDPPLENPDSTKESVFDLVNVQYVADAPTLDLDLHMVMGNQLYSIKGQDTYVFDFDTTAWSYLGSDSDLPSFIASGISFIKDDKWTIFTTRGLYEFDSGLQNWKAIDVFPLNEFFNISAFYIEEEDVIYYIDPSNGNRTIYKYLLATNESIAHGTYDIAGKFSSVSPNTFIFNDSFYITYVTNEEVFEVFKFSADFTKLEVVNTYNVDHSLENSVAMQYGDYIIFGLGGIASLNNNLSVSLLRSDRKFYYYDLVNDNFSNIPTPFYEARINASLATYNSEFYLINGFTVENNETVPKVSMEKLEFDFVENDQGE